VKESVDRFGIIRRAGTNRVVVRRAGFEACERFRKGCTIRQAKLDLAAKSGLAPEAVDLGGLLRSLEKAGLIASIDGKPLPEACPPSLYSAYRYYLRFHIAPALLRLAYRKLPASAGRKLAHWVQRLDMRAGLWPKALRAEEHFERCPRDSRPAFRKGEFARRYFHQLTQNIVDFQTLESMTPERAERWFGTQFEYEGLEHLDCLKREKTPIILSGFHFCATKLIPLLLMRRGYDTTQVWVPDGSVDLDLMTRWLNELKRWKPEFGRFNNIPDFTLSGYRRLLDALQRGEVLVWFGDMFADKERLDDQKIAWRAEAAKVFGIGELRMDLAQSRMETTLCGQRVYLNSWIGAFTRLTGAAVVPAALIRLGKRMRLILESPLRLPARATASDVEGLNRALFARLDSLLRLYPDQWFGWHSLSPAGLENARVVA
jgi:lauroyl/myristoyl acyltransferase